MIQFMPKSFENGALDRQTINQGLVQSVRLVGEYRGKQALFKQQSLHVQQRAGQSSRRDPKPGGSSGPPDGL